MTYYIKTKDLKQWLKEASFAIVSKNKSRKDLWLQMADLCELEKTSDDQMLIPTSDFHTLQSFCMVDGKADQLSKDEVLSYTTTLTHLIQTLRWFEKSNSEEKEDVVVHHDV